MDRAELLKKIQSYRFAAYDLLLYLDTHPDDKKAFEMFSEMVKKMNDCIKVYQEKYGPLTAFAAAEFDEFKWLDSPWPWQKEANR